MNKNFNISNYNLDLIKCLQNESGIYFILDPTKAIHDKKHSDVYDIFIPENSDGVTLHVQKVNNEYKCIGVSITKRGIDINTGTRIFNTKIADWLEQLFNFNKSLGSNNNENEDGNNNWSNMERNGANSHEFGTIVNSKNTSINANPINNIGGANNNEQGNASGDDKDANDGDGNDNPENSDDHNNSIINNGNNNKYNNYNNVRHNLSNNQTGVPITNLIKNSKGGYDNFENNDNYNNAINMPNKSKNSKNPINQGNCNLNVNNNLSTHIIPSSNLSSSQSKKQNQHTKQIRLNQMNNSHKSHLLQYHNSNYDDKNSKLYNNTVINKHISSENPGASHASNNNDTVKGNKIGCNTRQKNSSHALHNGNNNSSKGQQQAYNENLGYRPTLFNLLEVLSNHNITTPDQRVCIRGIVTDFLNNELPHGKIYAYIGAVVGHDILHDIIKKLEKDPNRNAVPDASGLARIEASFGLSKSSYDFMNHNSTNSSMNNIPNVLFNNRNLNSALLNNHIYSNILSNVANNNNGNIGDNMGHSGMLNADNEKISNNKTANDINNMMMKYGDNDKLGGSYNNNMLNMNKKKALNMLNMRYMDNNIADMANLGINNMNSTDNNYMSQMNIDLANLENLNNAKNSGLSMQEYLYASKNLHNVNSLNRNSNITEDEEELMKVIKKNIETYKMNNIKNILISSVFGRIKWLKIMNESPHAYLYGHSIVKYGNKLYMFGGTNNKHKKVPFNHTLTFSLIYYNYKLLPLSGNYPEERDGHTTHLVSLKSGLSVFLFGGANNNIYYNDIYILDMETRKWSKRIVNGKLPLPRHQHCSLVYPAKSEHLRGEKLNLTEGVIVYGGKCLYNNNIVNLNDMWIFLFQTNMWVRINYLGDQVPTGRYGMNLIWSDTNTLCLFGGEYLYSDKTCKTRKLLDDMWTFRLNTPVLTNNIEDTNTDIKYPSYENAVNTQDDLHKHQKGIKSDAHINNVNGNNGMPAHDNDNGQTDNLNDQNETNEMDTNMGNNNNESQAVDNKEGIENSNNLANKIKITGEWKREIYEGNIGCRSNYSSIFITQRHQDFKGAEPKTIEKLMLLCSGITYDNKLKIVSSDEIYVYFFSQKRWYLLKGKLYNEEYMYNARQRHVGCFFESKNVLGRSHRNPVPCIFIHGGFKKNSVFGDAWLLSLTGENPLRLYEYDTCREKISTTQMPLYYFRDTHSISLLYTFCTLQKWLFGAFANLVDNSVYAINPAENVFIKYELTPEHDGMISIQDDGEGLDFNAMNRILRMYGNYKNYDNNSFYNNNNNNNIKKHSLPNNDDSDSHEIDNYDDNDEDEQEYNEETNNTNDANNNENNADQSNDQYDNSNTGYGKDGNNGTDEMQQNEEGPDGDKSYNNNLSEGQNCEGIIKKENDIRNKNGPIGKKKCTWNDTFYYKRKNQYYFYNDLSNSIFDIKYGVGFKTAFARIASSCAIMSRTINTIGIGLLSLELMNHCDAKELATPLCMWKLPNKELINRNIANKSEHRHHQKLLMSYTPFNSPSLLAEQINILGTYSGTRLLYWNFRDDMDFVIFNPTNNNIYLSSAPLSIDELKSKSKKRKNAQGEGSNINSKYQGVKDIKFANRIIKRKGVFGEDGNLKKFKADVDNPDDEGEKEEEVIDDENNKYNNADDNYNKEEENIKKEHDNMSTSSKNNIPDDNNDENKNGNSLNYKEKMKYEDQLKYNNNNYFKKRMNLFEYNSHLSPSISKEKYNMNEIFPLWDHPKDSIDYCLSTYLYWLYLRRSTNIFLQNTLLIPTSMRREKDIIANKNNNDTKGKKKKKSKLRNKKNNKQNNANNPQNEEQADSTNNQENEQMASNEENNGDTGNASETAAENNRSEQEHENDDDNNHSDAQNENNINNEEGEEGETSEQNQNDDIKNENDGTNKEEGEKEENNNAEDGKEKDNYENDANAGLSKLEKQKLEEALEYGISQDVQAQNSANKNDTDDEDEEEEEEEEEEDEDEEDDEEDEEEEEEKDEAVDEEAPKNDEDNANINETNNEIENDDNNNVENEGAEVEGEANEGDEVGEDGVVKTETQNEMETENNIEEEDATDKNTKVKKENKNKVGKTVDDPNEDSIASRRKRRRKKDDLAADAGANGKKNGEIEKMKKENYVNVYMENFKIKDEYYINNPSKYTLYHFLRRKLYKMVESHYLFTPADHTYGSFIMMGFLNDNNNTSMEVNRVCETGILLYYKNRLIKRLDAPFIDTPYNLFLSKYPPSPSLYEGNLYKYALTVIVNVPNWLKPSVSKQEFVHENNHAFLVFKKKLVTLIKHYLSICEDVVKLNKWRESRDMKLKRYLEKMQNQSVKSRNDSDYENDDDDNNKSKNYNIIYNDEGDYMNNQNDGNKKKKEEINYSGRNKPSSYANDNDPILHKNKKTKTNNDDSNKRDQNPASENESANMDNENNQENDNLDEEKEHEDEEYDEMDQEADNHENYDDEKDEQEENDEEVEEDDPDDEEYNGEMDDQKNRSIDQETDEEMAEEDEEYEPGDE
ncbi:conserved Plasmodium protein, unknown function [Plasmodium chabaudi adami]|uniref:Kelch domain-containing protein n=1 Tax=Plasmodium chabaudi adami TaxID=5826 RepID=A0A1D3LG37_PLACE|nr:conserved Plasmodium protein, unknown function [Plasmodium chabaudi adami]